MYEALMYEALMYEALFGPVDRTDCPGAYKSLDTYRSMARM